MFHQGAGGDHLRAIERQQFPILMAEMAWIGTADNVSENDHLGFTQVGWWWEFELRSRNHTQGGG